MAIVVDVQLTGIEVLTRSQLNRAMIESMESLGLYWWANMLPKHFDKRQEEYNFQPRSLKYDLSKEKSGLYYADLVKTGEGMREAESQATAARIKSTRHSVVIPLPRKFNWRRWASSPPMADEVRAVTPAELRDLETVLVGYIENELDRAVPAQLRNRGFRGGRVQSLRLSPAKRTRTRAPAQLAAAA